jgi:S1-C subfamily serine protease
MNVMGIAPQEREEKRKTLLKRGKLTGLLFFFSCLLPIVIVLLFGLGLIQADPPFPHLEQPVALVNTGSSTGTAFLVGETRLLTARHVVERLQVNDVVQLTFEKAQPVINTKAKLLWKDTSTNPEPQYFLSDVAVLELENPDDLPENFPRLVLGNSDGITTKDKVILIGYPGGLFSNTAGKISNDKVKGLELFQLDVNAWQGNSGGPLLLEDTEEVIGIVVAGLTAEYQGINFANKINNAMNLFQNNGVDVSK